MRRSLHIVIAAALAAICVLPAAGQSYKKNKVRPEPELLTFSRRYDVYGKTQKELFWLTQKWPSSECGAEYVMQSLDYGWRSYHGHFNQLKFGDKTGNLILFIKLHFMDGSVILDVYDVFANWNNHRSYVSSLTTSDPLATSRGVRNKTLEYARDAAADCFNLVADSLEEFLRNGPPMELKRID